MNCYNRCCKWWTSVALLPTLHTSHAPPIFFWLKCEESKSNVFFFSGLYFSWKGKPKKTDLQGTPPPVTPEEPREGFITKLYPKKVQWRQADDVYVNVDLNTGELDVTDIAIGSGVKQGFGTESMKVIKRSRRKPRLLRKGATADDIKMDDVEKMILQNTISQKRNLRFK